MTTTLDPTSTAVSLPKGLSAKTMIDLYEEMVSIRKFELVVQDHYRNGKLPGFGHLYIGEEATAVGICAHLTSIDWVTSTHRGHGHALAKGLAPRIVLAELAGKSTGCCGGRGGSMHLYAPDVGLFGTNGLVGGGIPSAVGVAISARVQKSNRMAVSFFGDGGVNHGTFHESINFAAVQNAPVVFVCENNLYATATPLHVATKNTDVASKASAYGIPGIAVDGNDVLAVWQVMQEAARRARAGEGPTLIEARTYRVVGHHEGDQLYGTYRTKEEVEAWKLKCPILNWRRRLIEQYKVASAKELDAIDAKLDAIMQVAAEFARTSPDPDPAGVHLHVFAEPLNPPIPIHVENGPPVKTGFLDAIRDGIAEEMRRDKNIIYLGEGIGERGGSFAHTKNLWQEFGGDRVIDTPICELGFTGAAIGAAATGSRAVSDLMFSDFLFEAASQIVHQGGKLRYMSNNQISVPMIVRSGCGEIRHAGPHHSGMYHPVWSHTPGLIVVMPSTPADAKGLMKTAFRAHDPVIFMEHKSLFSTKGDVPTGEYLIPFGKANIVRAGKDITIATGGILMHRSLEAATALEKEGISCEVIDLRTLVPLDVQTLVESVSRTHRMLVVDEGFSMCGIGAEIAATIMESAFDELDAPVGRLHTEAVAQPFAPSLEKAAVVTVEKIIAGVRATVAGTPPIPRRVTGANAQISGVSPPPAPTAAPAASVTAAPAAKSATGARKSKMAGRPINMPHGDLTISEAKVVKWLKAVGASVKKGETIVEVETDKATVEVESSVDGVLVEILAEEGSVVAFGEQLATIGPA